MQWQAVFLINAMQFVIQICHLARTCNTPESIIPEGDPCEIPLRVFSSGGWKSKKLLFLKLSLFCDFFTETHIFEVEEHDYLGFNLFNEIRWSKMGYEVWVGSQDWLADWYDVDKTIMFDIFLDKFSTVFNYLPYCLLRNYSQHLFVERHPDQKPGFHDFKYLFL